MGKRTAKKPINIHKGDWIDYHEIIGGPVTQPRMQVISDPVMMCGTWVVWLHGKSGCVSTEACTPHNLSA